MNTVCIWPVQHSVNACFWCCNLGSYVGFCGIDHGPWFPSSFFGKRSTWYLCHNLQSYISTMDLTCKIFRDSHAFSILGHILPSTISTQMFCIFCNFTMLLCVIKLDQSMFHKSGCCRFVRSTRFVKHVVQGSFCPFSVDSVST